MLALAIAVVVVARPPALRPVRLVAWGLALVACAGQLPAIMDTGARHFLPPTLLLVPCVAAALAQAIPPSPPVHRALAACCALLLLGLGFGGHLDWAHRYRADEPLYPRWVRLADAGESGSFEEVLDPDCFVYLPDGERSWPGARDVFDVGNVQMARWEMQGIVDGGGTACVQWASRPWVRFTGDAQLEYLDRAVRVLGLVPVGWIEDPPDDSGRWILFEGRL